MKHNKRSLDEIIDNASRAIREEQVDPQVISASASRVWERISQEAAKNTPKLEGINNMETSNHNEQIRGCEDFQSLVPAYLEGKLSKARTLLLEDHSNECVPCRKDLQAKRNFANAKTAVFVAPQASQKRNVQKSQPTSFAGRLNRSHVVRATIAAGVVICLGIAGLFLYERVDLSGSALAAIIEGTEGEVLVVSDAHTRQLAAGEQLKKGEKIRTAKDSNAVLKLADGSMVEMRERSEFSISENMRGVTVQLDRGDVIVEAAKQHNGRLYVQTPDSLVSVKGTIFAVESGTKGSRVSVVEGEVKVKHSGKEETLLPGDQATSTSTIDKAPVKQTVSWSRNATKYASLVTELGKLRTEVARATRPGVRYTSSLVNLVPTNTVFYAALPNITESLAESQRIMQERIKQNPALAEWSKGNKGNGLGIDSKTMARIQEFGSQLGEEIVVAGEMDAKGEPSGILVLGELKNAANFRTFLDGQIAKIATESKDMPGIKVVEDPMTVAPAAKPAAAEGKDSNRKEELYVWINGNVLAASPEIESFRGLATASRNADPNRFANSSFHQRIAGMYKDGVGLLVAADLEKIVGKVIAQDNGEGAEARRAGFEKLGVNNLRHFVVEQKEVGGKTLSQANLTFAEANRGIASWLAAPGSMGALDFISPNANVVTAFVVKEPKLLVDDLLGFIETVQPEVRTQLAEIEQQQGISLRNDFAATLGGEFAFAIDGPLLPTPSWKVIMEVYDHTKLQGSIERMVQKVNGLAALHGKGQLGIEQSTSGDRTIYSLTSTQAGLGVHYTFSNGYMVAAPTRALLEQSLSLRASGNTLVRSSRFISSLPQDGNTNFSAIMYHDLAPVMSSLGDRMKSVGGEAGKSLPAMDPNAPPTLAYAYANGDRITLAANTDGGPFGISPASLLGMPNSFEMQHILSNAVGDAEGKKK